jgi:hypothetical protein
LINPDQLLLLLRHLLEYVPWEYDTFRQKELDAYMMATVEEFMKDYERGL